MWSKKSKTEPEILVEDEELRRVVEVCFSSINILLSPVTLISCIPTGRGGPTRGGRGSRGAPVRGGRGRGRGT